MTTQTIEATESSEVLEDGDLVVLFRPGQDDELRKTLKSFISLVNADDTDDYVSSAALLNASNGTLTLTRKDGGTVTVDLSGINTDDYVSSAALNASNGTLTLTRKDGGTVTVDLSGINTDDYVSEVAFNMGFLTFTRKNGTVTTIDIRTSDEYVRDLDVTSGVLVADRNVGGTLSIDLSSVLHYVKGARVSGNSLIFSVGDANDITVDLSSINPRSNDYVTGVTLSGSVLTVTRRRAADLTVDLASLGSEGSVTGVSFSGDSLSVARKSGAAFTASLASLNKVPTGGSLGDSLVKKSNTDNDLEWKALVPSSGGTTTGSTETSIYGPLLGRLVLPNTGLVVTTSGRTSYLATPGDLPSSAGWSVGPNLSGVSSSTGVGTLKLFVPRKLPGTTTMGFMCKSELYIFLGNLAAAGLGTVDTSVDLIPAPSNVEIGDVIVIGTESMRVSTVVGDGAQLIVTRSVDGSTLAIHAGGAAVYKQAYEDYDEVFIPWGAASSETFSTYSEIIYSSLLKFSAASYLFIRYVKSAILDESFFSLYVSSALPMSTPASARISVYYAVR